jgi:hypothetical protein
LFTRGFPNTIDAAAADKVVAAPRGVDRSMSANEQRLDVEIAGSPTRSIAAICCS